MNPRWWRLEPPGWPLRAVAAAVVFDVAVVCLLWAVLR